MRVFIINLLLFIFVYFSYSQQIIEILPQNMKQSTQIYVKKGDVLTIEVKGQWSLWDKYGLTDGAGHSFKANDEYGNWGALLGMIGNSQPFLIGNQLEMTSESEGILYLYPNKDKYLIENASGKLEVTISGGTHLEDFIKSQLSGPVAHYQFDPRDGVLVTDLLFEKDEMAMIYAFGHWTMWEGVYPLVNAEGHDFLADGENWGKLYAGLGTSTGQCTAVFPIGQHSDMTFPTKGVLTFFPHVSNFVALKNGKMDLYIVGGKEASGEDMIAVNDSAEQYFAGQALEKINQYRAASQLPALVLNESLTLIASEHAKYMIENDSFSRIEESDRLYYMGATPDDRAKNNGFTESQIREMFCQTDSVESAVNILFNTVYHRIRLMNPTLKYLGYGSFKKEDKTIHVFDFGYEADLETEEPYFIYPPSEAQNVALEWSGFEQPEPLPEGTVKPVGSPVTILFKEKIKEVKTAILSDPASGEAAECFVITPFNDRNNRNLNAITLVPKYILSPAKQYSVQIKVIYENDLEEEVQWTFTTTQL